MHIVFCLTCRHFPLICTKFIFIFNNIFIYEVRIAHQVLSHLQTLNHQCAPPLANLSCRALPRAVRNMRRRYIAKILNRSAFVLTRLIKMVIHNHTCKESITKCIFYAMPLHIIENAFVCRNVFIFLYRHI